MTVLTEGEDSFFLSTPASLFDDEVECASSWASKHIYTNKALKWIVGRYVEADNPNSNGQYWELSGLRMGQPTITYSPMNIDHRKNEIVGTFVASELLYPKNDSLDVNPFIEVLGAYWKAYFPETLQAIESAFNRGALALSMECVGSSITCVGTDEACGGTFAYKGPFHESYCQHILSRASYRQINEPHFVGGALILPPNRPGWSGAHVKEVSALSTDDEKDTMIKEIAKDFPHLSPSEWEMQMWQLQMQRFKRRV